MELVSLMDLLLVVALQMILEYALEAPCRPGRHSRHPYLFTLAQWLEANCSAAIGNGCLPPKLTRLCRTQDFRTKIRALKRFGFFGAKVRCRMNP